MLARLILKVLWERSFISRISGGCCSTKQSRTFWTSQGLVYLGRGREIQTPLMAFLIVSRAPFDKHSRMIMRNSISVSTDSRIAKIPMLFSKCKQICDISFRGFKRVKIAFLTKVRKNIPFVFVQVCRFFEN